LYNESTANLQLIEQMEFDFESVAARSTGLHVFNALYKRPIYTSALNALNTISAYSSPYTTRSTI